MDVPAYLYHGTFRSLVPSILEHGLLAVPKDWRIWPNFSKEDSVYLADNYRSALEWARDGLGQIELALTDGTDSFGYGTGLMLNVLRIETRGLYLWLLIEEAPVKWGEYGREYRYRGDIPPELITVLD